MIIRTKAQLGKDVEPQQYYALIFEGMTGIRDFVAYRNALTMITKAVLSTPELDYVHDECFWLLQLSEFISTSLDDELDRLSKHGKNIKTEQQ